MEGEVITLQDIFVYKEEGLDNTGGIKGRLVPTGLKPGFMDKLAKTGVVLPTDLFTV